MSWVTNSLAGAAILGFASAWWCWGVDATTNLFEGVFYLVTILAAVYSVIQYKENSDHEKVKWLFELYRRFYDSEEFQDMFDRIDYDETAFITQQDRKSIPKLDQYLNFFQFVAILHKRREIGELEIKDMFSYPLEKIASNARVRPYLRENGYKVLDVLLNELGYSN